MELNNLSYFSTCFYCLSISFNIPTMSARELQEIISPKFTEQVLLDIVNKKSGLRDVQVKKITIGSSKKGDSYLSNICRFTLEAMGKNSTGAEETVSFPVIVKFQPKNIARRKTWRLADYFENEIIFYEKVWSVFQQFQEDKGIRKKFDNVPLVLSAYYDGSNDYIAMLDISYEGYKSSKRCAGLKLEHTAALLSLLGRFHALSLAIKDQAPDLFENAATSLKENHCSEKLRGWYERFQQKLISMVKDAVAKELPPVYLEKFNKLVEGDFYGKMVKLCEVKGPLSVVAHGDVWVPNFLIKYGSPEDTNINNIVMIDFQVARYATLAHDITFFLYSCVDPNLLDTKWDELIAIYHKALADGLESFGSDRNLVTVEDIHKEIKSYNTFGMSLSLEAATLALLEDDEIGDLEGDLDTLQGTEAVPIERIWDVQPIKEPEKRRRVASIIKLSVDKNFM